MCYMRSSNLVFVGKCSGTRSRGAGGGELLQRGCRREEEPRESELAPAPALAVPCSSGLHAMGGGGATTLQADLMAAGGWGGNVMSTPALPTGAHRSALGHLCVFRWLLLLLTCQPPPILPQRLG